MNLPVKKMLLLCRCIDFGELLAPDVRAKYKYTTYDLIANIVHDGEPGPGKGTYRVHVLHKVGLLCAHIHNLLVFSFFSCYLYNIWSYSCFEIILT